MAPAKWSNLPPDILSIIAKIFNTDVDTLRLRCVCSSWRSSVSPRPRPSPFPLKVPSLFSNGRYDARFCGGQTFLNYTTLYRLSPPEFGSCAGDPSDGWLIRVSEVNPNRFSFLSPLSPKKVYGFPADTIPKYLNLLDYRISELCKCYTLDFVNANGSDTYGPKTAVRKVMVLWNYRLDCDFVVLVMLWGGRMIYWKFGDMDWTIIDSKGYDLNDMVVSRGKCYAIGEEGMLVSFDSKFTMSLVDFPRLPLNCLKSFDFHFLAEYKSDLYVMSIKRNYNHHGSSKEPRNDKVEDCDESSNEVPLHLEILKKCNSWKHIRCLGKEMLVSCIDVSLGLSMEDFRGCKSNCVYMGHSDIHTSSYRYGDNIPYLVYDLGKRRMLSLQMSQDCSLMYWPPPRWLVSS